MIDSNLELDQYPQVSNRGVIQLVPKQLYADWFNYTRNDGVNYTLNNLETISFLTHDFDTRMEFNDWLETNFQLLFEIRLSYACNDKCQWPENRAFTVFKSWFDIIHSDLILDLLTEPIKVI
jgi:hypothetical protein